MKKVYELIKPFLSIILGALMVLEYMNWLGGGGAILAIGIIAIIFGAYYLAIGIVTVVAGPKLGKARFVLECISAVLFPLFFFVYRLCLMIGGGLGVTGWVLAIIGVVVALALVVFIFVAAFTPNKLMKRLAMLFAMVFGLVLLLALIFDLDGTALGVGAIVLVDLFSFLAYGAMAFVFVNGLGKGGEEPKPEVEPAPEEAPAEEPKPEE